MLVCMRLKNITPTARSVITGRIGWYAPGSGDTGNQFVGRGVLLRVVLSNNPYSRWACRHGKLSCGCFRSPVTRRMILFSGRCEKHLSDDIRRAAESSE
jgi:hypothetical protein